MKKLLLLAAVFLLACSDSGTNSHSRQVAVIPGEDFDAIDMFVSSYMVQAVFRNNRDYPLPSFYADYLLQCGSTKKYGELFFVFDAYEQSPETIVLSTQESNCTLTISTIRDAIAPAVHIAPWTGAYTISTDMFSK